MVSSQISAINLLFPPHCPLCDGELATTDSVGPSLCDECRRALRSDNRARCERCASPLPPLWGVVAECPRCRGRQYRFDRALALGAYRDDWREAVLKMKRRVHEPLVRSVGRLLGEAVDERWPRASFRWVVPVPMHWGRRFSRGMHTAAILAEYVAQTIGVPVNSRLLCNRRKTRKQGTLTPSDRLRNVRGAFRVSAGYDITDAHLLLVDDIMTTGATVSESARQLKRARAASVTIAVVARGTGNA